MRKQLIFKLLSTVISFTVSIIIGIVVPRMIGPQSYGEFTFLNSTFLFIFQFLLFSSNTAYVYFLSQGKYDIAKINTVFFLYFLFVSIIVFMGALLSVIESDIRESLWSDYSNITLILFGYFYVLLTTIQSRLIEFGDSTNRTVVLEKVKVITRVLLVVVIIVFPMYVNFEIEEIYIVSILSLVLFSFYTFSQIINFSIITISELKVMLYDVYCYVKPLIAFTLISSFYTYLGRYTLQNSSGSIEQGFYNFSYQFALIPVMFLTSIMSIVLSQMTKVIESGTEKDLYDMFFSNVFKIYVIHGLISFFVLFNAKDIIFLTVGEEYYGAVDSLKFLSLFSLMHSFGMFSANVFYSTGKNKTYSNINNIVMILGLAIFTYILFYGELNSSGLAKLMCIFYFTRVTLQIGFNLYFFEKSKIKFFVEFSICTIICLMINALPVMLSLSVAWSAVVVILLSIIVNVLAHDYIGLRKIFFLKR